jgi:hypothetical protein
LGLCDIPLHGDIRSPLRRRLGACLVGANGWPTVSTGPESTQGEMCSADDRLVERLGEPRHLFDVG